MKRTAALAITAAAMAAAMTSCAGWDTVATVGGGTGWFAGDYAPYYWSDWNNTPPPPPVVGNGPGSIKPGFSGNNRPVPPPTSGNRPGLNPGDNRPVTPPTSGNKPGLPGNNTRPTPPSTSGNGSGSNPGTPAQGGFRGQK